MPIQEATLGFTLTDGESVYYAYSSNANVVAADKQSGRKLWLSPREGSPRSAKDSCSSSGAWQFVKYLRQDESLSRAKEY